MSVRRWKDRLAWLAMVSVVLLSGAWVQAQQPESPAEDLAFPAIPGLSQPIPPPSPFWIGLECFPADPTLRAQLGLEEGIGLVVAEVAPDGPAAKAGVKPHDLILTAGDKSLSSVADLVEQIEVSQGITHPKAGETERKRRLAKPAPEKELSLEVLRAGEKLTITVTPAARESNSAVPPAGRIHVFGPDSRSITHWMEQLRGGPAGQGPLSFWVARPHVVLDGALPDDMTVTIKKRGKELANIIVERGEETWEITQDKLADLPDEIRRHVEPLLGPLAQVPPAAVAEVERVERELLGRVRELGPDGAIRSRVEQRIDQLNEQLEGLRRTVEDLRKPAADEPAPPAEEKPAPTEDLPEPKAEGSTSEA